MTLFSHFFPSLLYIWHELKLSKRVRLIKLTASGCSNRNDRTQPLIKYFNNKNSSLQRLNDVVPFPNSV